MINGVPQNDMENGWVYWSNWDGVGDTTFYSGSKRTISKSTIPSIGGTMNIITDPTSLKKVESSNKNKEKWFYENYFQL